MEIVLWFVALLVGIAAAVLFVARRAWPAPLTLAIASVAVVMILTFAQPPVAVRVLLDLALVTGLVATLRIQTRVPARRPVAVPQAAASKA